MANMNTAISVGWAVMENEFFLPEARFTDELVNFFLLPLLQPDRLSLW